MPRKQKNRVKYENKKNISQNNIAVSENDKVNKNVITDNKRNMDSSKDTIKVVCKYDFKKCRSEFDSIGKGKKSIEYSGWKATVKKRIANYNSEQITDLIKKIEISRDALEKNNLVISIIDFISKNIPILTAFMTVIVALYAQVNDNLVSIQLTLFSPEEINQDAIKLADIIGNGYVSFGETIRNCCIMLLGINTFFCISAILFSVFRAKRLRYYTFLLEVLHEESGK